MDFLNKLAPKHGWLDLAVLTGLLLLVNGFFAPRDIGWTHLQPTPWLLLPILMGCRYGFASGMAGAGVAALVVSFGFLQQTEHYSIKTPEQAKAALEKRMNQVAIVVLDGRPASGRPDVQVRQLDVLVSVLLRHHGYLFAAMFAAGGICGQIQRGFKSREILVTAQADRAAERLKKLDTDLFLLREAKSELERLLATRDAELSTLDAEIRRLFDSEGDELWQDILLLLNRQARVSDAAIYKLSPDGQTLLRKGLLGSARSLGERLALKDVEMAGLALKSKSAVTIPEFWQRAVGEQRDYLMVVPLLDSREQPLALLVVTGMPFISLTKKSVYLVALICRWASRVAEVEAQADTTSRVVAGVEGQRVFTEEFFRTNVQLAFDSWQKHSLPSAVVLFAAARQPKTKQAQLEALIMANIRGGDFPAAVGLPIPHLAVLLPLCGERGVGIFADRILAACRKDPELGPHLQAHVVTLDTVTSLDQLWADLTRHVG
jgi:hypothetical protein